MTRANKRTWLRLGLGLLVCGGFLLFGTASAWAECGDGKCETGIEDHMSCPEDCFSVCGNLVCEPGESPAVCPLDCCGTCGNAVCASYDLCNEPEVCPEDCGKLPCGNGECEPGENPDNCAVDCGSFACGNGECEPGEDSEVCPEDCGANCGNCICEGTEDAWSCPPDCGWCGDGVCSNCPALGEKGTPPACPLDCQY